MIQTSVHVVLFLIISLFFGVAAVQDVSLADGVKPDTVLNGTKFFSLNKVCKKGGYSFSRDAEKRSFICSVKNGTIRFFENNRFAVSNDSIVKQLAVSPVVLNSVLYLPEDAMELFPKMNLAVAAPAPADTGKSSVQMPKNGAEAQAAVPANKKGIRSVSCSVKQNGTLLTVELSARCIFPLRIPRHGIRVNTDKQVRLLFICKL
ncbi:MAG TPA: hypothetical protein VHO70_12235, partial [Chitinispirillaceae bacterium]|nr:hypothetical protein [Chitinispirillaceae bacterium]